MLGRAWLLIRLWWDRGSVFTSDGRLLKLLARPVDRGTTWGYTRSLLIIFFRRRDFADAIRCNIKNKPSLVILFCANTSCAIWTNRWRSFLFPRVSVSLSLRRGAPPPPPHNGTQYAPSHKADGPPHKSFIMLIFCCQRDVSKYEPGLWGISAFYSSQCSSKSFVSLYYRF